MKQLLSSICALVLSPTTIGRFIFLVIQVVPAISCSNVLAAQAPRRNLSGEARVPLMFTTKTMIFYQFDARIDDSGRQHADMRVCKLSLSYEWRFP